MHYQFRGFMYNYIFAITAGLLYLPSFVIKGSYYRTNIIVYYFLLPLFWCLLINPYLALGFLGISIIIKLSIKNFKVFCNQLFIKSVVFLERFEKINWNYVVASVNICVFLPFIITNILLIVFHPKFYNIFLW